MRFQNLDFVFAQEFIERAVVIFQIAKESCAGRAIFDAGRLLTVVNTVITERTLVGDARDRV